MRDRAETLPDETRIDRWLCAVRLVKTPPFRGSRRRVGTSAASYASRSSLPP